MFRVLISDGVFWYFRNLNGSEIKISNKYVQLVQKSTLMPYSY